MIRRPPRSTQSRSSAASDVYKRQLLAGRAELARAILVDHDADAFDLFVPVEIDVLQMRIGAHHGRNLFGDLTQPGQILTHHAELHLSLIHISEPTRLGMISYAVFCL